MSGSSEVLAEVDVNRRVLVEVDLLDELGCASINAPAPPSPVQYHHLGPDLRGTAAPAPDRSRKRTGGPPPRAPPPRSAASARMSRREIPGWSASSTTAASLESSRARARRRATSTAPRVPLVHDDPGGSWQVERLSHPLGVVAQHHDDLARPAPAAASTAYWTRGFPLTISSCFLRPNRLPLPAARTIAEITSRRACRTRA